MNLSQSKRDLLILFWHNLGGESHKILVNWWNVNLIFIETFNFFLSGSPSRLVKSSQDWICFIKNLRFLFFFFNMDGFISCFGRASNFLPSKLHQQSYVRVSWCFSDKLAGTISMIHQNISGAWWLKWLERQ